MMEYKYHYLPAGAAKYESAVDAHAQFILNKQLKDKELWEKFVQVYVERPDFPLRFWIG